MLQSRDNNKRIYVIPTCDDVLCGRGVVQFQHPGNQKLREKIAENLEPYATCNSRQGRSVIIRETIRYIQVNQGGRFLKSDKDGNWYDGGMEAAKSRVSVAFRDARVPNKVKCMEHLKKKKTSDAVEFSQYTSSSTTDLLSALPLAFKSSRFTPRRDSLSSLGNLIMSSLEKCEGDSVDFSNDLCGTSLPSSRRSFLDSSISSIDTEVLDELIMPERRLSTPDVEHILNSAINSEIIDCCDITDRLDFGGRNFFDITESEASNHDELNLPRPVICLAPGA
mmetsp:Transcript_9372/g.14459  ORF Transcript_9372/g.14459 Transcript_9372/m.14459 type:complete len:280 (-) Transcript_9372:37-876(-)